MATAMGDRPRWDPKTSPNVCKRSKCRGPIEAPDGGVTFFDGGEAHCIDCGANYTSFTDGETLWFERVKGDRLKVRTA